MSGVMGVDPSLTSTGLAHWSPTDGWDTGRVVTKGTDKDTGHTTGARLDRIVAGVNGSVDRWRPDLILVERPAFSSATGHAADRGGLFHLLTRSWRDLGTPHAYVNSQARICYAVGKFRGSKDEVMAAAIRRYVDADIIDNNTADAVVLAAMGARWWYGPHVLPAVPDPPLANRRALSDDHVDWPSRPQ
jgi:Holliday junction resolvasome RuvABC endonuclease subunit